MPIDRRLFAGAVAGLVAAPAVVRAEPFPSKQVKLIVPFPAGGATDIVGRTLAEEWGKLWKTTVIVENRPGAGSNLGSAAVARSEPDGHTLLVTAITATINPHIYKQMEYNPVTDLAPVTLCIQLANLMTVPNSSPAKTVQEFIAHAKANAGKLTFASSGTGTSIHLCGELFKKLTNIEMTHVPYRGSALAISDLITGRVDVMFDNIPFMLPQAQGGQVRGLAVTTKQRVLAALDFPTIDESGVPGFDVTSWFGVTAPAKTPPDIIAKINADTVSAFNQPEIRQKFEKLGARVTTTTPGEFGQFIRSETEKWGKVVKDAGVKMEG
ncbi:tripartite tricarboxylate transporter substrate binding protein [Terrarubrum flagellatum]|uniref:Bug family tripartite tricarboxylate transporter substrate binding protein n=1 Tax=Terrirubrum flagellatum TaxID=2895980 RepID=UPI0031456AE0